MRATRTMLLRGRIAVVTLLPLACAGRGVSTTAVPADPCRLGASPAAPVDSLVVLATGNLLSSPGRLPDAATRFVATHAYETLVRVDCQGRVVPGLAVRWASGASTTTLELRDDATFWSAHPVTAHVVVAAWQAAARADTASVAARLIEGTSVLDARRLRVPLAPADLPLLADPSLVVTHPGDQGGFPEGTGAYRVSGRPELRTPNAAVATLVLEPVVESAAPRLVLRAARGPAARDLLDAGVDLLLTDDPGLARYAATTPRMTSHALAWDRTYVLLTPGALVPWQRLRDTAVLRQRDALARDVVRGDARGAQADEWLAPAVCRPPAAAASPAATPRPEVTFAEHDPVARALAERVAAVASMSRGGMPEGTAALGVPALPGPLTARGMSPRDLDAAIASAAARAFVVAVPFGALSGCGGWAPLLERAPWVASGHAAPVDAAPAAPTAPTAPTALGALAPLVDTRWRAVVRAERGVWLTEWAGTLRLVTGSASAEARR